jgi:hypothetical protein
MVKLMLFPKKYISLHPKSRTMGVMNVQFDKVKALNALLYVACRVQRKDFHKIFKIIYFADRQHLAEWGKPILAIRILPWMQGLFLQRCTIC